MSSSRVANGAVTTRRTPQWKAVLPKQATPRKQAPQKPQPVYYSAIFEQVLGKRLAFYKRIVAVLSVLVAVLYTLISPAASFYMLPIKVAVIFMTFVFIQSARELTVIVDFDPRYNSLSKQIIGELASKRFMNTLLAFSIAGLLNLAVLYAQSSDKKFTYYVVSPTRTIKPFINDEFVYYWYHGTLLTLSYSIKHAVCLKSKLDFKFGTARVDPKVALMAKQLTFVKESALLTLVLAVVSPLSYWTLRGFIYKLVLYPFYWPLGLNHKMPLSKVTFASTLFFIVVDFILSYTWDLANHVFDVYATVGCISVGKTLSSKSKDPVNTLLSGLRDSKRSMVKLTAFQELAHISTSDDPKVREFLYVSHFKESFVWPTILDECAEIIRATSKRIRAKPKVLAQQSHKNTKEERSTIFGNSRSADDKKADQKLSHYELKSAELVSPTKKATAPRLLSSAMNENMEPIDLNAFVAPILKVLRGYYKEFLASGVGKPFKPTLQKEAESRVVNAANFGNAIIAISYIALSAEFEDKKNIVLSTLPEILSLLEDAVSSTQSFIDFPPVDEPIKDDNPVKLLHDLSMRLFFEIVIKYNHMLNDFALTQPVFNLSKWCIDLAIEQQKEEEMK